MSKGSDWLKLRTDFVDDERLRLLDFNDRWHFIAIMCCKGQGILEDENHQLMRRKVAVKLGVKTAELDEIAKRLSGVGLVDVETLQPIGDSVLFTPKRLSSHEWSVVRQEVFLRDDFTCSYCGRRGIKLECDHVVPVSRGGGNEIENLTTACLECNRSKRDKTLDEWWVES